MAAPHVSSDSRERDFGAAHAIAELELELAGGLDVAVGDGREPLAAELGALERAFTSLTQVEVRELLEVGCGQGTLLIPLLRRGYWVTGLDLQSEAVTSCRGRVRASGLSTRVEHGDARTLVDEADYDAVLLMRGLLSTVPTVKGQLEVLRRVRKAVRPGGLVVVDHRNLLSMWPIFGRKMVRRESFADGRVVEFGRQATVVSFEGRVHERRWARVWGSAREAEGELEARAVWEQHDHLRIATVDAVRSLMQRAGLEVVHVEAHPVAEGPWHADGALYGTSRDDPSFVWLVGRRPV